MHLHICVGKPPRTYEMVCRMTMPAIKYADDTEITPEQSWIMPVSEGKHWARTWIGARLWCWKRNRGLRKSYRQRPPALPTTRVRMDWEVRRIEFSSDHIVAIHREIVEADR